jgi:hypothetical protein
MTIRYEDQKQEVIDAILKLLDYFGGEVVFNKPLRFRLTPHSKTIYIYDLRKKDNFYEMELDQLYSIRQKLIRTKNENSKN